MAASAESDTDGILWEILDDHLDEAEYLTEQWCLAARSPLFSLTLLQDRLEKRLGAHLDGLAVGGEVVAQKLLWSSIAEGALGQEGRFAACGLALLADRAPGVVDRLIAALVAERKPKVRNGLAKALAMSDRGDIDEPVRLALYATDRPEVEAALLAVLAARRVDVGPIVGTLLSDTRPPAVRAAAARAAAAATSAQSSLFPAIEALLGHDDEAIASAALRTGLIWGSRTAWRVCEARAAAGQADAMLYLAALDGPAAMPLLTKAVAVERSRPDALFALGFAGLRDAAEACLPYLDAPEPHVARLAGEAVSAIAGVSLEDPALGARRPAKPANDRLPALADDLAEDLMPKPVDALPVPVAANLRRWWKEHHAELAGGQRYLRGQPFGRDAIEHALHAGPLRRTGLLAFELAVRSRGEIKLPALRLRLPKVDLHPSLDSALRRPLKWR